MSIRLLACKPNHFPRDLQNIKTTERKNKNIAELIALRAFTLENFLSKKCVYKAERGQQVNARLSYRCDVMRVAAQDDKSLCSVAWITRGFLFETILIEISFPRCVMYYVNYISRRRRPWCNLKQGREQ